MSKSKTLISGCGLSWSGQERKTWVRLLKGIGADILDVGGPAVSNQWILNRCCLALLDDRSITTAIVQLTSLGKLDVEIRGDRMSELVIKDSLRNFVIDDIWPSSVSTDHPSKKLWTEWLWSPRLEIQDIQVKLRLLAALCRDRGIELCVLQGYHIPWNMYDAEDVVPLIENPDCSLYQQYTDSERYRFHDHSNQNSVPELGWQLHIADKMCTRYWPNLCSKLAKLAQAFHANHHGSSYKN